jgi:pectate lyase
MPLRSLRLWSLTLAMAAACGGGGPSSPSSPGPGAGPSPPSSPGQGEPLPTGGAGGDSCRVTSLDESGPGTLHECISSQAGARTIVFDVDGTLSLPENTYVQSNLTIDAMATGARDITVRMRRDHRRALILEGPVTNVVIRGLRFEGEYGMPDAVEYDLLALDGEGGRVSNVLVERCTFVSATDGALDITGDVSDAIVRWNLFYDNPLTMLIRYGTRERLSLHRNVFAENGERNPQIRGEVKTIDQVNNIVYDWKVSQDGYGTEIRNDPGAAVDGNFVGNVFLARRPEDGPGFTIYNFPGASSGRLWVADNLCSPPCEVASTVSGPLPAPLPVNPWPASELGDRLLPGVGAPHRTARDSAVLERLMIALRALR